MKKKNIFFLNFKLKKLAFTEIPLTFINKLIELDFLNCLQSTLKQLTYTPMS